MLGRELDLLACWRGQRDNCAIMDAWRIAPLCLMSNIWRERNAQCFEDREKMPDELKNMLVKTLLSWVGTFNISQLSTLPQFVNFCSFRL